MVRTVATAIDAYAKMSLTNIDVEIRLNANAFAKNSKPHIKIVKIIKYFCPLVINLNFITFFAHTMKLRLNE